MGIPGTISFTAERVTTTSTGISAVISLTGTGKDIVHGGLAYTTGDSVISMS